MNRELAEVRRYWPRAKRSKSGARFWAAGKRVNLTLVADLWEVDGVSDAPLPSLKHIGATIPEAMRAAGFGVRPEYATRGYHFAVWRAKKVSSRKQVRLWRAGCGWSPAWLIREYERFDRLPALVSTQRPRKGARLGRRKRSPDGLGKNWRAAAHGGAK